MKKTFAFLLGLGLILFTSCQQKDIEPYTTPGETGNVNITVYASDAISVRSSNFVNSALGGASNVGSDYYLRYILAVYDENGDVAVAPQTKVVTSGGTNFNADLTEGETYTIVCWADFVTDQTGATDLHYNTSDLTAITYVSGDDSYINDESRDAYFVSYDYTVNGSAVSLTLKRPFAKLRLVATDWANSIHKPSSVSVTYSSDRNTVFNAKTGESSTSASASTYTGTIDPDESYYSGGYDGSTYGYRTIYVDYILLDDESDITLSYTTYNDSGDELHSYDIIQTVPLVRNCLTTVIGKLLSATDSIDVDVDIDDGFDTEYEVQIGAITVPAGTPTYTADDGHTYPVVYVGGTLDLSASVSDLTTASTDDSWDWESDNESLATVSDGTVTGVAAGGPVQISATQSDESGHITAYACLSVYVLVEDEEPAEGGVKLNETAVTLSIENAAYTIDFETPADIEQTLSWSSGNTDVVTVSSDGVLTVAGFGSTTVTVSSSAVTAVNGYDLSGSVTVTVPKGYYNEHLTDGDKYWTAGNNDWHGEWDGTPADGDYEASYTLNYNEQTGEHYMTVKPSLSSGTTGRGDLMHDTSETGVTTYLDAAAYPILCFRLDDIQDFYGYDRNITLDTNGTDGDNQSCYGGIGGSNNQWIKKYTCSDNSCIIYYDLTSQQLTTGLLSTTAPAELFTFQLKYADIKTMDTSKDNTYRFFWFMTFASTTDMTSYLDSWSAETGITYSSESGN